MRHLHAAATSEWGVYRRLMGAWGFRCFD